MAKLTSTTMPFFVLSMVVIMVTQANALMPNTRPLYDIMFPSEDPFRILEQSPLPVPKDLDTLALARLDWKETAAAHVISLDVPGLKKDDIKIEVEENRVLRVSGESKSEEEIEGEKRHRGERTFGKIWRQSEEEIEGEKWHRGERTFGKFWRQFRLPMNADLDHIKAHLEDGLLRITVPKFAEEKKRQPKVVNIAEVVSSSGEDIKTTKAES